MPRRLGLALRVLGVVGVAAALSLAQRRRRRVVSWAPEGGEEGSTIVVKFGGAAITVKRELRTLNRPALEACCEAVAAARRMGARVVVIHGAGCFGHHEAKQFGLSRGARHVEWRRGLAETRRAVTELNALVTAALGAAGVPAVRLSPSAILRTADVRAGAVGGRGLRAIAAGAADALDAGLVPVLHGDVVLDGARGCSIVSGDLLCVACAAHLAHESPEPASKHNKRRVVFVTDVDGVYDRPPHLPGARLVRHLRVENPSLAARGAAFFARRPQPAPGLADDASSVVEREVVTAGTALTTDVTGGMTAKLDAALRCAGHGSPVTIVSVAQAHAALEAAANSTADDVLPTFVSTRVALA